MSTSSPERTLHQHIKGVLYESIKTLFPLHVDPCELIKPHVWRDRKYVGENQGKVVPWRGWSANLVNVDFRYRAIFIDVVDNVLPLDQRIGLFGEDFVAATVNLRQFVVMFVLDFPLDAAETIKSQGFVPRKLTRAIHACVVSGVHEFLSQPTLFWAAKIARLVMLQRLLAIHRKPLESNEVPLQNLLYRTGYLHSYIVNGGLELQRLSRPRRSGDFGHDFHALVRNASITQTELFPIGIEVYTGAIGYHIETIPKYVRAYGLRGIIVIAKDNPLPSLNQVAKEFPYPVFPAPVLSSIGSNSGVAIHHLPMQKIVLDLQLMRDELESLIPTVKFHSG